jgi:integrase/recombinase XerD
MVGAIPLRRRYRLADVPCALSWDQVQRLLDVVDRHEPSGRRNYAMLLLFASYGLRGCEVRALCLDNIDWSRDAITVFTPKTGRYRRLPLTRAVGEAILDYLREERPPSLRREIFLSQRPPHAPLRSKINLWLADCLKKAGIEKPRGGAHILRHSLAVHMLRGGQTLKDIGDVLGHRSPETTFIYTKLHLEDLRTVALDPEVVS